MAEDDVYYFLRRAAEELAAAENATSPEAAEAHRDLARRYCMMIDDRIGAPNPVSEAVATPQSV